jgi:hypothetical protein
MPLSSEEIDQWLAEKDAEEKKRAQPAELTSSAIDQYLEQNQGPVPEISNVYAMPVPGTDQNFPVPVNVPYPVAPGVSVSGQTMRNVIPAAVAAGGQMYGAAKNYLTNPVKMGVDIVTGAAPAAVAETVEGVRNAAGAFQQKMTPQMTVPGSASTGDLASRVAAANKILDDAASSPAMREIARRELVAAAQINPASVMQRLAANKVVQSVAPVAATAARVAGPVVFGMQAYDAMQFAREAELGPRLAAGQGLAGEQAFRQMNQRYGARLTPQEAQTILQNNNPRDIQAFGGRDRLMAIAQGQQ